MLTTILQLGITVYILLPAKCPVDELHSIKSIPLIQPLNSFLFNPNSQWFLCSHRIYLRCCWNSLHSQPVLKISFLKGPRGSPTNRKIGLTSQGFKGMFPHDPWLWQRYCLDTWMDGEKFAYAQYGKMERDGQIFLNSSSYTHVPVWLWLQVRRVLVLLLDFMHFHMSGLIHIRIILLGQRSKS